MNIYVKKIIDEKIARDECKEEIADFAHSLLRNFYIKTKEELKEIYDYLKSSWPREYDNMDFGSLKHIDCGIDTMIWDLNKSISIPTYSYMLDKVYFRDLLDNAKNSKNNTDLLIDYTNRLDYKYLPLRFYILDKVKIRRLGKNEESTFLFLGTKTEDPERDLVHSIRDYWGYSAKRRNSSQKFDINNYRNIREWIFQNLCLEPNDPSDNFIFLVEEFLTLLTPAEANTIKARYYVYPNDLLYGKNYLIDSDVYKAIIPLKRIETIMDSQHLYKTIEEINDIYNQFKEEITKKVPFPYISVFKEFMYYGGEE